MTKELAAGEKILIDTNSLVAWSDTIQLDIRAAGGCCTCCCGGEGLFNTVRAARALPPASCNAARHRPPPPSIPPASCTQVLVGPGTIYVQSMSLEKFKRALVVHSGGGRGNRNDSGAPLLGEEMQR